MSAGPGVRLDRDGAVTVLTIDPVPFDTEPQGLVVWIIPLAK